MVCYCLVFLLLRTHPLTHTGSTRQLLQKDAVARDAAIADPTALATAASAATAQATTAATRRNRRNQLDKVLHDPTPLINGEDAAPQFQSLTRGLDGRFHAVLMPQQPTGTTTEPAPVEATQVLPTADSAETAAANLTLMAYNTTTLSHRYRLQHYSSVRPACM